MEINDNGTASAGKVNNELGDIDGLGEKSADALYEFGIHNFADLTQHTPDFLSEVLQKAGVKVSAKTIENKDWIGKARKLAESVKQEPPLLEPEATSMNVSDETWREHAMLTKKIEYMIGEDGQKNWQTYIYREQNAGDDVKIPGITPINWVNWILEKANLPPVELPVEAETEATLATDENVEVQTVPEETKVIITDVQISIAEPSSSMPEKRLSAVVHFQLAGDQVETLTDNQHSYRIESHAINLENNKLDLVASKLGKLQPQQLEYSVQQTFPIPEEGRHQLHHVVLLLPPLAKAGFYQGTIIKSVP